MDAVETVEQEVETELKNKTWKRIRGANLNIQNRRCQLLSRWPHYL